MTPRIYCASAAFAVIASAMLTSVSAAQTARLDSLTERLRRAEETVAALQKQVAEQSESGVQTRSRIAAEISGRVLITAFGNTRRVNNVDNPQFVRPDTVAGFPARGLGLAARQTSLALAVKTSDVLGGEFRGDLDVDFYGGQQASGGGRTFPLVRLRTARGFVTWKHVELMVGQETPLISRLNPRTPAAIGTPGFATSGNLWLWLPQGRATVEYGSSVRFGAQGAILAPTSGNAAGLFDTDNDFAERSVRPYLQFRGFLRQGEADLTREIGCGMHQGWLDSVPVFVSSTALACDFQLPVTERIELRGEYFRGTALRGLGGGGIGQNFDAGATGDSASLETRGGWAQLNVRPLSGVQVGLGFGGDHPDPTATRRRNDAFATYIIYRPSGPLFLGAEFRRMRTQYTPTVGQFINEHVTLAMGFEF